MANIFTTTVNSNSVAAGTREYGFGGEVPVTELWNGEELAKLLGITQGTAQHTNQPWLKFYLDGKVILKSKKPYRHSISFHSIVNQNAVYGNKIITDKNGNEYKIRLIRGALTDPSKYGDPDRGAKYSEWNKLMLPIHEKAKNKTWKYPQYVEPEIPTDWSINYTDEDLGCGGVAHWCQEASGTVSYMRMSRGFYGVSSSDMFYPPIVDSYVGWSPVLELIKLAVIPPKLLLRHTKTGKIYTIKEGSFS